MLCATYPPRHCKAVETGHFIRGLFGFASDGVYRAFSVATKAVSSYLAISPLPTTNVAGGIFSVALSPRTFFVIQGYS